jgi:deoxyribonuclease V
MASIQESLRSGIIFTPINQELTYISGVDAIYFNDLALCVIITFHYKTKKIIELTFGIENNIGVYKAGFLAFHELPAFLNAWSNLVIEPDLVIFDGYGYAHPNRLGLATHASFFIQKPTFGIAKTPFIGKFTTPANEKGTFTDLLYDNEIIGAVVRTCIDRKPVYVSVGNYCSLSDVLKITMEFTLEKERIPKLTALPDKYSKKLKVFLQRYYA